MERWLADALSINEVRTLWWDNRLAGVFYLSGLLIIIAVVIESGLFAVSGVAGLVVSFVGMVILIQKESSIEQEAVRRGLPHERLKEIATLRTTIGYEAWRHRCDVRLRWLCWEAGETMSRGQRYALADDLAEFSDLEARQWQFVQAMQAERERQEPGDYVALAS